MGGAPRRRGPPPSGAADEDRLAGRLREALLAAVPDPADARDPEIARFLELQRDYPSRGGKALRGRATLLAAAAFGAAPEAALPAAVALELFQNWVLVHDDVEDDSATRRGRPALHRIVGAPLAINVGDALHVRMWRVLVEVDAPWRDAALRILLDTIDRTAEGQHLDLAWVAEGRFDVREEEYLRMVEAKTAHYTVLAPLRLGAAVAGATPGPGLEPAALALGRAFQIRDDVLSLRAEAAGPFGKPHLDDLYEGKRTLVLARAFATAGPAAAARLRALLGRPREAKTEEEMREALELLEGCGAIRYAQAVAERDAAEGLRGLRTVLAHAADPDAAGAVLDLMASLADRET